MVIKLKKLIVPKFIYEGNVSSDVEILFEPKVKEITVENFNQDSDEFYLSDDEIDRLSVTSH